MNNRSARIRFGAFIILTVLLYIVLFFLTFVLVYPALDISSLSEYALAIVILLVLVVLYMILFGAGANYIRRLNTFPIIARYVTVCVVIILAVFGGRSLLNMYEMFHLVRTEARIINDVVVMGLYLFLAIRVGIILNKSRYS